MKINTKTRYAIRTMIELAMNNNKDGLHQKDISKNQDISFKYLDHIIAALKSAGLIENVAGRKSGYKLTKSVSSISVYDIYNAINPELKIIECINDGVCYKDRQCAVRGFWIGMNNNIINYMESQHLDDLVEKQININQKHEELMFHI